VLLPLLTGTRSTRCVSSRLDGLDGIGVVSAVSANSTGCEEGSPSLQGHQAQREACWPRHAVSMVCTVPPARVAFATRHTCMLTVINPHAGCLRAARGICAARHTSCMLTAKNRHAGLRVCLSCCCYEQVVCEGRLYSRWLTRQLEAAGAHFVQRKLTSLAELSGEGWDVVLNCSGLGARQLLPDRNSYPIRGQIMRVRAPWVNQCVFAHFPGAAGEGRVCTILCAPTKHCTLQQALLGLGAAELCTYAWCARSLTLGAAQLLLRTRHA
jgi:hypothetical protein